MPGTDASTAGPQDPGEAPDLTFRFLTQWQARRVRVLAQRELAGAGREVTIGSDHLRGADGHVYGLSNLAATCHGAAGGEREWPDLVAKHVRALLDAEAETDPLSSLEPAQVLARTFARVTGLSTIPRGAREHLSYARPICGDLVETLALDSPTTLMMLHDRDVAAYGLEAMRVAGLENLRAERFDRVEALDAPGGGRVHVVMGESVYTASKLLLLPEVLHEVFGEREYPNGVLVGVPFRNQLVLHVPEDSRVVPATRAMTGFCAGGFSDSAGPVSPFVFWWRDGSLTQVSVPGSGGRVQVDTTGEFGQLVSRLLLHRN